MHGRNYVDRRDIKLEPNKDINKLFSFVHYGGEFCVGGVAPFPCLPGLKIHAVGEISMPLQTEQAKFIKSVGCQAPYGKGADTLVDLAIRNSIQIDPEMVSIPNGKMPCRT